MFEIEFDYESLIKYLRRVRSRIFTRTIVAKLIKRTYQEIQSKTALGEDADGKRFTGYSEKTREKKIRQGKSPTLVNLNDTGEMMNSITQKVLSNQAGILYLKGNRPGWGTNALVAEKHNEGKRGGNNVPKREFWGIGDELADLLLADYAQFVEGVLRSA